MEIDGRIIRQMVLFALFVLIIPMVLFPVLLGTKLMQSSMVNASFTTIALEIVFYGFCLFFFNKETTLARLFTNATICFVARYVLGVMLGGLIALMYDMNLGVTISFGTSSFWPAVGSHVLATPFILKPIFIAQKKFYATTPKPAASLNEPTVDKSHLAGASSFVVTKENINKEQPQVTSQLSESQPFRSSQKSSVNEIGFQKAVNYIGENGTVLMAAVVDYEGLLLSSYQRAMFEAEDIAPLVLPIVEQNKMTLHKMQLTVPEKTDMMFENQRLIIASENYYTLVVISERSMDDILNIRINQALEMIRIYTAERYDEKLIGNAERIYV